MKKILTLLALVITLITNAQAPQGFNYQATVRNSSGALIVNQNVNFKFNIMLNSSTSLPVFSETHMAPTDDLGQVNLVIGQGTATTGSFSTINWANGSYFLGIELNTGNGYIAMGTTQLLSVPYALYANSSGNSQAITPNLASVLAVNNGANNLQIKNLANPTDNQDAVTMSFLLAQISNLQQQITNSNSLIAQYPPGSIFCTSGPTQIVPVLNPITGKTWMDRNLGASQVATSSTDSLAYGDSYQWGRRTDGHQCRNSATTTTLSATDQPTHSNFILGSIPSRDWRISQNDNLWQGVYGENNPCPFGYRIPTENELNNERLSWVSNDASGAFTSPLKFSYSFYRSGATGNFFTSYDYGRYWTSSISSTTSPLVQSQDLNFVLNQCTFFATPRSAGNSIRCIKN